MRACVRVCVCVFVSGVPDNFEETGVSALIGSFYSLVKRPTDWLAAKLYCESLHQNSHLVAIDSADEQQALAVLLKGR